jgi:hypothetical protein
MGTGGTFPGLKLPGHEGEYSPPPSAKVKDLGSYTSIPPYGFMTWCLVKQHRVHNSSGALQASYPMGTGGFFPWG